MVITMKLYARISTGVQVDKTCTKKYN